MDFSFTEAQKAVSDLSRKIFAERVTPKALKAAEAERDWFFKSLWGELGSTGLLGTSIPEAAGGSGHGFLELCSLLQEAGAAVVPLPLWATLVLGAQPIAEFGTIEQIERLLTGVAAGELILTGALAEPGSDQASMLATTAVEASGQWVISGAKTCVPAAHLAHRIVIPARTADGAIGLFLVDPSTAGVSLTRQIATTGEPQFDLVLTGAHVAEADVLVSPLAAGRGREALDWLVQRATVGLCAMELGVTERVLRMTAAYTTTRQQFERPIATFQAVAQRVADAYIDVEAIRLSTWKAAWRLEQRLPASQAVAVAKYWASEAGHRVVYAGQHLHAGIGFDLDYPLYRYYLWSKQIELTLGAASTQLARLGAELAAG